MANGTYYITISEDKNIIANLPKSDFNSIVFDDKTIDSMKTTKIKTNKLTDPLQQIYYGAPGTGKSFEIDTITKEYDTIRTTFHPDSDYSTFVGAYKPTMTKVELRDVSGHVVMDGKNPGLWVKMRGIFSWYVSMGHFAWWNFAQRFGDSQMPHTFDLAA